MPEDKDIYEQIAEFLGVPVDQVVRFDTPDEQELYGGKAHEQPAATGKLAVKIIRKVVNG